MTDELDFQVIDDYSKTAHLEKQLKFLQEQVCELSLRLKHSEEVIESLTLKINSLASQNKVNGQILLNQHLRRGIAIPFVASHTS